MDHIGLGDDIWDVMKYHTPAKKRARVAREIIKLFGVQDLDMHGTELWRAAYKPCTVCNHNNDGTAYKKSQCKFCGGTGETPR